MAALVEPLPEENVMDRHHLRVGRQVPVTEDGGAEGGHPMTLTA
ncbi:hypothetical protein ACH5AL_34630 [Actinacidiphila glaucinigra]